MQGSARAMTTLAAPNAQPAAAASPGRPVEIEEWSNRLLIHPLSARLAMLLVPTPVTPNMVSAMGAAMAACAAGAFLAAPHAPWPLAALVGLAFLFLWHVFDGADGQLARRTARASTNGELIDGICDHLGQLAIYLAFAWLLTPRFGGWAWALAAAAGLSRAAQASAYEGARRNYRRWVYGAGWIRQTLDLQAVGGGAGGRVKVALGRLYVAVSESVSAGDGGVEAAMGDAMAHGPQGAEAARQAYRARFLPLVKQASLLSANYRSLAAFLSMLAGTPLYFLVYEAAALNLALVVLVRRQAAANRRLQQDLAALPSMGDDEA